MVLKSIRFVLLGALVTTFGCTREMSEKSQVSFDLSSYQKSDVGSQSVTKEINFVAINVSGGGMARIVCRFDEKNETYVWSGPCSGSADNPLQVTIDNVPSGGDRLVQVLVIVEEFNTATNIESERFNYGEIRTALKGGNNLLSITTTAAPAVTNMDGGAEGRYLMSDGTGYTGPVALEYRPPTGSSPMEIFQLEMFAGWFNIFLMDNVPLQYRMLDNGQYLFGGPVTQTTPAFNPGNGAVLRFVGPPTYSQDEARLGQVHSVGFWLNGTPDTTKSACQDNTPKNSSWDYTDVNLSTTLSWPSSFSIVGGTFCGLTDPLVSTSTIRIGGDLVVKREGGGDGYLVRGPYQKFNTGNGRFDFVQSTISGTQLSVAWKYLPGVTSSQKFAGSTVFFSANFDEESARDFEGSEGFDCSQLPGMGFSSTAIVGTSESVTIAAGGTAGSNSGNGFVVVCPRKSDGTFFKSVVSGKVTRAPATQLAIRGFNGFNYPYFNANACSLIEIQALDNAGFLGEISRNESDPNDAYVVQFQLFGGGSFHDDPDCMSSGLSTLPMYESVGQVFFKQASGVAGLTVLTHPGESVTISSGQLNVPVNTANAEVAWRIYAPEKLYTTASCQKVMVGVVDANEVPTILSTPYTVTLTSSQSGGTFFTSGSNCISSVDNDVLVNNGYTLGALEFLPGAVAQTASTVSTSYGPGAAITNTTFVWDILTPPPATYMYLNSISGSCQQLRIGSYYSDGPGESIRAYPTQNITYSLSGSGGTTFHTDGSSCSVGSNPLPSIQQTTLEYEKVVYVKFPGNGTFSVNVMGPDSNWSRSINVTIPP